MLYRESFQRSGIRKERLTRILGVERLERRDLLASDLWTQRGGDSGHDNYVDAVLDVSRLEVAWTIGAPERRTSWGYFDEFDVAVTTDRVFRASYHGSREGHAEFAVTAIDKLSGKIVWETPIFTEYDVYKVSSPAYDSGVIYVNAAGHSNSRFPPRYIAINAATGAIEKEFKYSSQHGSSERPTIVGEQLVGPARLSEGMHSLAIPEFTRDWFVERDRVRISHLAVSDEFAFASGGEIYSLADGSKQTIIPPKPTILKEPIVGSSKIVYRTQKPSGGILGVEGISVFDANSFEHIWSREFAILANLGGYDGQTAIGNGIVAAIKAVADSGTPQSSQGGEVLFFSDADGSMLGNWLPPEEAFAEEVVLTNSHALIHTHQSSGQEFGNFTRIHVVDLSSFEEVWSAEFPRPHTGSSFGQSEIAVVDGLVVLSNEFQTIAFAVPGPNLDKIPNMEVNANSSDTTLMLTGISSKAGFSPIRVSAVSENPELIAEPFVEYSSPSTTAHLRFSPKQNRFGETVIKVLVEDGGNDGELATPEDNTVGVESFRVTVVRTDSPPTIHRIEDVVIQEDALDQHTHLSGISAGSGETQSLRVTAEASPPELLVNPSVHYSSESGSGSLTWKPLAGQYGIGTIVVTVEDGGLDDNLETLEDNASVIESFTVTVNAVNDLPTLDQIGDVIVVEDSGEQFTRIAGISAGDGEMQKLRLSAASGSPDLLPNPSVSYASGDSTAELHWKPAADQFGIVMIFVTVEDGGFDNDFATLADNASFTQSFTVTITPVNDPPQLDVIENGEVNYQPREQITHFTGLTPGGGESQTLRVTATSDSPELIADPIVHYLDGESVGWLLWTPLVDRHFVVNILVQIEDGGLDNDLHTSDDNALVSMSFAITINPHVLTLSFDRKSLSENDGETVGTVSRDTGLDAPVVVILNASDSERVFLPSTVTIPEGSRSAIFPVSAIDNQRVEGNSNVEFWATATAHTISHSVLVVIEDDVWSWQNPINQFDVNSDQTVSPIDALLVINRLNSPAEARLRHIRNCPEITSVFGKSA